MDLPDEDTIRILITTDNHVGYNETDPITGDDSWKTFNEIMTIAKKNNVDMIVQSGDLFHINKPTKKSLYQVMKSIRSNCLGNRPCELELLSDPSKVLQYNDFTNLNYEDPNYNISIPIFGISGNHDDASGDNLLSPMDILHVSGLLNHFGKVTQTDNIQLTPLLFQKGITKLALYGIAAVRDERLFRTFKEGNVKFEVPTMQESEWFNMICIHQNHTQHTNTAFLPEQFLPDFLDLVIWGHEHECIPNLAFNPNKNFNVLQPGSSVATSLCDAEAKEKFVFILEVKNGEKPNLIPIKLNTVRTFLMKNISLSDVPYLRPHDKESISKYLTQQVEIIIEEANEITKKNLQSQMSDDATINFDLSQDSNANEDENEDLLKELPLPLIRLRVDYSSPVNAQSDIDFQVENPRRFSNRFVGRVANSNNVVQFYKKRKPQSSASKRNSNKKKILSGMDMNNEDIERILNESGADNELQVQTLVNDFLSKMQLSLLPELGMNEAVKRFVDKDEKHVLKEFIDQEIENESNILAKSKDFNYNEDIEELKHLMKQVKQANINTKQTNELNGKTANTTSNTKYTSVKKVDLDEDFVMNSNSNADDNSLSGIVSNSYSSESITNMEEDELTSKINGTRTNISSNSKSLRSTNVPAENSAQKKSRSRTTGNTLRKPTSKPVTTKKKVSPISDSVVISDESDLGPDEFISQLDNTYGAQNNSQFNVASSEFDDDPIELSDNDNYNPPPSNKPKPAKRIPTTRKKSTTTSKSSRSTSSRTPKTDVLQSLLNRKRR
ncbi:hypothetical protein TBLA_0D01050 [Henningerozyma blattae CBS 6284]|uniref:Double-strand break repair protein n=1 Tax=Henningerozyma blattae (strain ATCC 34711 / CBS 6284 / DSM 70876 / NBRC 10599 / NRRL Y-10934 / UCD 77-7) TaxID=1071380 RepID=I2H2L1_HENB6|nr:hypothetical protein TBLA_0D01050 [Tetrapisispora blattae CBS 6284]CCH60613.1 hypothetical protein TBLA_0D01050 [Tetrapisispora blattae CBS 6284]